MCEQPSGSVLVSIEHEHRELQPQSSRAIGRRQPRDLFDSDESMPQRVRVDVQPTGCLGGIADGGEVHPQGLEQLPLVLDIMICKQSGRFGDARTHGEQSIGCFEPHEFGRNVFGTRPTDQVLIIGRAAGS